VPTSTSDRPSRSTGEDAPPAQGQAAPRPRSWAHREAQAYRRRRREYVAATTALVTWLQARLEDVDEIEAFVSGRAKEVRSVEQKLRARERAEPGRDAGYADLPDLIGVRVVVRLESEIAVVADELHRLLLVDKDVDARDERGREETPGYRGRHFDVRARPGTAELPELLASQPAEIQVRTRAADVWASLEHELRYKGTAQLPPARSRQFVLAASLLELAERELEDLRAWQLDTQRAAARAESVDRPAASGPIDEEALAEMLADRYPAAPSTPRRLSWMLELLREMHLDSATALRAALPAAPDPRILALVEGRATVDTVRMLDDELLLVAPEAYLKANRAVPDERNPHRVRTLQRRQRRLAAG
jgi:putative GTP pyrophosphokinase